MKGKRKIIRQKLRQNGGDPKFYASCYGKIRHTRESALERAKEVEMIKAYKCKYGDHWHVGRKPEKVNG